MPHGRIQLVVARYGLAAMTVAAAACQSPGEPAGVDTTKPPETVGTLPADDPGTVIAAPGYAQWGVAWTEANGVGRLIIPRFRNGDFQAPPAPPPANFAIASVDPATMTADTIVARDDATFSYLRIGATTGRVFLSYAVPGPSGSSSHFGWVEPDGGNITDIPLPRMFSHLVMSPDETWGFAQTVANVPFYYTRLSLTTGSAGGNLTVHDVVAVSPEGTHVLSSIMAVTGIEGSGRTLDWSSKVPGTSRVLEAAWVGDTLRLLIFSKSSTPEGVASSVYEWDEGAGAARHLGTVNRTSAEYALNCVAWQPASSQAAIVMDSIDASGLTQYRKQWTMTLLASGQAKTFGTLNSDSFSPECALSADGAWFAIRPWTNPGRVYVKRTD